MTLPHFIAHLAWWLYESWMKASSAVHRSDAQVWYSKTDSFNIAFCIRSNRESRSWASRALFRGAVSFQHWIWTANRERFWEEEEKEGSPERCVCLPELMFSPFMLFTVQIACYAFDYPLTRHLACRNRIKMESSTVEALIKAPLKIITTRTGALFGAQKITSDPWGHLV